MQPEVSLLRLSILRAFYAFVFLGLAVVVWPGILAPAPDLPMSASVVNALLGGVGLLALVGVRYPLKMLPLLMFELAWKLIWLVAYAVPLLRAGPLTDGAMENVFACLLGAVLVPLVLPWSYVWHHYGRAPGYPWRRQPAADASGFAS